MNSKSYLEVEDIIRDLQGLASLVFGLEEYAEDTKFPAICIVLGQTMHEKIEKLKDCLQTGGTPE